MASSLGVAARPPGSSSSGADSSSSPSSPLSNSFTTKPDDSSPERHCSEITKSSSTPKNVAKSKQLPFASTKRWRRFRKIQRAVSLEELDTLLQHRPGSGYSTSPDANNHSDRTLYPPHIPADVASPGVKQHSASCSPLQPSPPKHIPIVIPRHAPVGKEQSEDGEVQYQSNPAITATFLKSLASPRVADFPNHTTLRKDSALQSIPKAEFSWSRARHIEIQIPSWAQPIAKQPDHPPRIHLTRSVFIDPFEDLTTSLSPLSAPESSPTPRPVKEKQSSTEPTTTMYSSQTGANSGTHLASANSSQSSLVGRREEYESASEAEGEPASKQHTPSQSAGPSPSGAQPSAQATPNVGVHLSGLVCNVHRTTGQEPPPLVGATTTVLGDKLYVFGGRRLASKPRLTSDLYELDLIHRHWTKIIAKGDLPPPRYFHSVCGLGDTKLVCYGGMSPVPTAEGTSDDQAEVIVMSDIHIYDVATQKWTRINCQDSPQGRYAHCAAILPSGAVFASASAPTSAMQHNPSGTNPNSGTLGVSLDGTGGAEMIVVGGQDSANHYIEQISVFNLRSLKWTGTTGMGRSCGAYRSVVCPLTTMTASQIGTGPHGQQDVDDEDDNMVIGSGAPMLIYSNYNFLDVKLELQVRLTDGTLTEKTMQPGVSPPGLRFPNGGVIDNHFVVSGTFLTSSKQEYALWALDLRTLAWSRIDAGGSIFSQGSWNRGVLWNRRNCFVVLGNRKRSLVDDYNNRRINFSNVCFVELEAFGLYENPRRAGPTSGFVSASASDHVETALGAAGRQLQPGAEDLGALSLGVRELSDMDFLAIDGTRIPVNSQLITRRWGDHFADLLKESTATAAEDTATLRPTAAGHPARNSSITITQAGPSGPPGSSGRNGPEASDKPPAPAERPRLIYLPHTAPTLQALLHYLYTSDLPSAPSPLATPQIFCSLLQLARPYKIDGLLEAVVERLHDSLDGRNAAAIFNAAAMAAGGGEGVQFASAPTHTSRASVIPIHGAIPEDRHVPGPGLRLNTALANGRKSAADETDDEDVPASADGDDSMSESEMSVSSQSLAPRRERVAWKGSMSSVVGLQKRGLRGLMEGRRMRERGRADGQEAAGRVGLGIA